MIYKDDWEKLAEEQFKKESKFAREFGKQNFGFELAFGVVILAILGIRRGVLWVFFASPPTKDDLWIAILTVAFPFLAEQVYGPIRELKQMQAKRAIRIEMKLDAIAAKQTSLEERADQSEERLMDAINNASE